MGGTVGGTTAGNQLYPATIAVGKLEVADQKPLSPSQNILNYEKLIETDSGRKVLADAIVKYDPRLTDLSEKVRSNTYKSEDFSVLRALSDSIKSSANNPTITNGNVTMDGITGTISGLSGTLTNGTIDENGLHGTISTAPFQDVKAEFTGTVGGVPLTTSFSLKDIPLVELPPLGLQE